MSRRTMIAAVMLVGMMAGAGAMLRAQVEIQGPPPPRRGAIAGRQLVRGEVTEVAGSTVTVKTEDGATMQIVTTDNTRLMKVHIGTVKVSDLKIGDRVMAAGNLDAANKTLHAVTVIVGLPAMVGAQGEMQAPPPGRRAFAGMQQVEGEVTSVAGSTVTVKTEDGATIQIVTTDNTRVMKGRGVTMKVSDLKTGDGVIAAGNLDAANKTLHAAVVIATDAAQLHAMQENLGKTYILGRVTAIDLDNAKMTVERPDHVSQTIGFDETTSFRRGGRGGMGMGGDGMGAPAETGAAGSGAMEGGAAAGGESITLADIKVGDVVSGRGSVKGGVFVPVELVVGGRGMGGGRRRGGGGAVGATPGPQ